jgi:putative PEP-CTERM system integral membrane protein
MFTISFWIFNITLILVLCVGFLPGMGAALIRDTLDSKVPIDLVVPLVGLVGVPIVSTIVGKKRDRLFAQPLRLFELFYAIEAPILTICLLRLFTLRDLTPVSTFLLASGCFGWFASCAWFWRKHRRQVERSGNLFSLVGISLLVLVSAYLCAIGLFFALPVTAAVLPFSPILVYLAPLLICLVMLTSMPLGILWAAVQLWWQNLQASIARYGKWRVQAVVGATAVVWVGLCVTLQHQPQVEVLALLNRQPADRGLQLQQTERLRQGLLNAYLGDYRYFRDRQDRSVFSAYTWLKFPQPIAEGIQHSYNFVTAPLTYAGNFQDKQQAADLYAQFFDTPIQRGEKAAIRRAVEANFNRSETHAGLLSIGVERVLLAKQQLKISPHGDWAEVELHETYANQTLNQEEVAYAFSLPESAVLTGVWLGESENLAQRYPFQVSTRGAAQQVYKNEIRQRVDPALLEQVGPQNYRLRIYPILPMGKPMHMWMTYKVFQQNGTWPLPHLSEQRNVYWSGRTQRSIDGKSFNTGDQWLATSVPAQKSAPVAHQLALANGDRIVAEPLNPQEYRLPHHQRLAIVIDGSYSMNAQRPEFNRTIAWLKAKILPHNQMDVYLTDTKQSVQVVPMAKFQPEQAMFYGTLQPQQILAQFKTAQKPPYDAIVVITDRGSYELAEDLDRVQEMSAPLWMVSLGGFPPAYDDNTLGAIQHSGGGVSTDIQTVMARIGTLPSRGIGTSRLNVVDNYAWFLVQGTEGLAREEEQGFAPIAARQWVSQVSETLKPEQLQQLDAVHKLAQQHEMVTPYSSMIVLVNDRQKQDLKQAEGAEDRFKREVEDQQLPQAQKSNPLGKVAATPEPPVWLLSIVGILLAIGLYHVKQNPTADLK